MDKYLANYSFRWSPGIKIEFCPNDADVTSAPPDEEGVYMHLLVLVLRLRMLMTKFIRSVFFLWGHPPSYQRWLGILF